MSVPTPKEVANNAKFREQAERIRTEQARRAKLRSMRVNTPLTRKEMAARLRNLENS